MKTKLSLLAAALALAIGPAVDAADMKPADKKDEAKYADGKDRCKRNAKEKKVMLTGSYIPQTVTRVGRITDSAQPVTVLTHEDLERTGAFDTASALRKALPAIH